MPDDLILVHELSEPLIEQLHALYQRQWWSQGRSLDDVRTMASHTSVLYALVDSKTDRLVAFCRVITDFAFRGMLQDVIVDEESRGQGIGRRLMEAVIGDPRISGVDVIGLWCKPELVPMYERFGFERANEEYCWLQRAGNKSDETMNSTGEPAA